MNAGHIAGFAVLLDLVEELDRLLITFVVIVLVFGVGGSIAGIGLGGKHRRPMRGVGDGRRAVIIPAAGIPPAKDTTEQSTPPLGGGFGREWNYIGVGLMLMRSVLDLIIMAGR